MGLWTEALTLVTVENWGSGKSIGCDALPSGAKTEYITKKATHGIRIHQEIINMQTTYNYNAIAIQTYNSSPHQRLQRHFEGVIYPMNPWRLSSSLYCCLCVSIRHQTISGYLCISRYQDHSWPCRPAPKKWCECCLLDGWSGGRWRFYFLWLRTADLARSVGNKSKKDLRTCWELEEILCHTIISYMFLCIDMYMTKHVD